MAVGASVAVALGTGVAVCVGSCVAVEVGCDVVVGNAVTVAVAEEVSVAAGNGVSVANAAELVDVGDWSVGIAVGVLEDILSSSAVRDALGCVYMKRVTDRPTTTAATARIINNFSLDCLNMDLLLHRSRLNWIQARRKPEAPAFLEPL